MKRFIITGAPGAGKTAILRQLELDGFGVVEEAATVSLGPSGDLFLRVLQMIAFGKAKWTLAMGVAL